MAEVVHLYPIHMFLAEEVEEAIEEPHSRGGSNYNYRATYQDRPIFIKRYLNQRGAENAFNEIVISTQINHENVVKLLGCCLETEHPILIYELLPRCAYNLLHGANPSGTISWENRLKIAVEIAYAITYLHLGKPKPIVHRDIKISSILLDEHYRPKLCDFELSITIPLGETHVEMDVAAGTPGYLDPNCITTANVSEKTDGYSFGMLLLKLLCGITSFELIESGADDVGLSLLDFIGKETSKKDGILELVFGNDLSMDVRQVEQATACLEVVRRCIAFSPDQRPPMKDVTQQLRQIERNELPPPSSSSAN